MVQKENKRKNKFELNLIIFVIFLGENRSYGAGALPERLLSTWDKKRPKNMERRQKNKTRQSFFLGGGKGQNRVKLLRSV